MRIRPRQASAATRGSYSWRVGAPVRSSGLITEREWEQAGQCGSALIEPLLGGVGSEVLAAGGADELLAYQPGQVQQCGPAKLNSWES
jgi:hypothetical protein